MAVSAHSFIVIAPLRAVYNQWTRFEEFPRFMEDVEEVRQEGEKRLYWKAKIAGRVKSWEAEITNQIHNQRVSWESVDGSPNSGNITFKDLGAGLTLVNAMIGYEPEGFLERVGNALGIPSERIEGDLQRFQDFIEERGRKTSG